MKTYFSLSDNPDIVFDDLNKAINFLYENYEEYYTNEKSFRALCENMIVEFPESELLKGCV